ncbi:MAG: hypothetical protein EOP06_17705 [Proteobacteria bacterium]|nr:MAG: hypothetical protein EOP06_17705 [Pseudomonadota bacterium]
MAEFVYLLCAVMSLICAAMLFRGFRMNRTNLLLWASASFALIAVMNVFLFLDLAIIPDVELQGSFWRNLLGAFSGTILLTGLIWELT